jgi:hypothetical protein
MDSPFSFPRVFNDLPNEPTTSMLRRVLIQIIHSPEFMAHIPIPSILPFFGDGIHANYVNYTVRFPFPQELLSALPEAASIQVLLRTAKRMYQTQDGGIRTKYLIVATIRVWDKEDRTVALPRRFIGDTIELATTDIRVEWWEGNEFVDQGKWETVVKFLKKGVDLGFESDGERVGHGNFLTGKFEIW